MRVLIIDEVHPILVEGLIKIGIDVDYKPQLLAIDIIPIIHMYHGLVVRTKMMLTKDVLLHATQLQFIARAGAGLDNIDTNYCDANNIKYINAGEANADALGEHTLAMLLSLATQLQKADKEVRAKIWDRKGNTGWELKNKTVGIIGFGNTGKAVAKKLLGFDVNVLVYDKYLTDYGNNVAKQATIADIQKHADILTLHVPLTQETIGMIDANWIGQCEKQIVLLNLSRGGVVKMDDVIANLHSKKIIAAGFDVLENEQINNLDKRQSEEFEQLIKMDNIVFSPHVGGWTTQSYQKISTVLLQKIKELTIRLK